MHGGILIMRLMIPTVLVLAVLGSVFSFEAFAQLAPFNDKGVTIGHVHYLVKDVDAHKKLWIDVFGAEVGHAGPIELIKLPGIIVLLMKQSSPEPSGEPTADHMALRVRDLPAVKEKLAAAKISVSDNAIATFPDGVRVELIEDKALSVPVAFHHFHLISNNSEIANWYKKYFGAAFPAAKNFPGGEVRFTTQPNPPRVPTLNHVFDHISFEVKDLAEFCKKLESDGVKLDMKIIDATAIGLKVTFVTDPIGTRIELTEGFAGK
jgi:catechol 2,3-dioxygenase-like lactoylglutathione lyase family enzyme